jgi:hypothetical protein
MLVHLNVWNRRVRDFPSRPIYGVGERSGIRLRRVIPRISWLLAKGFFWRLWQKYVIRDFHPLVLFYMLGLMLFGGGLALGVVETGLRLAGNPIPFATIVLVALFVISGLQLLLFAMWFDMESNKQHAAGALGERDLEALRALLANTTLIHETPRRRSAAQRRAAVRALD